MGVALFLTRRKCLASNKVRHDCEEDPLNKQGVYKKELNSQTIMHMCCSTKGFNGDKLKVRLNMKKVSVAKPVTVPCTRE